MRPSRGRDDGAGGQVFGLFGFLHDLFDVAYKTLKPGGIASCFATSNEFRTLGGLLEWPGCG